MSECGICGGLYDPEIDHVCPQRYTTVEEAIAAAAAAAAVADLAPDEVLVVHETHCRGGDGSGCTCEPTTYQPRGEA